MSYLSGKFSINSWQYDNFATSIISSSVAPLFAYLILFLTVSSNRVVSWLTSEICFLRDSNFILVIADFYYLLSCLVEVIGVFLVILVIS